MSKFMDNIREAVTPGSALAPPTTVEGGYGRVPGAKAQIDTTAQAPKLRGMSPADARNLMNAEILTALRSLNDSTTALTSQIGRQGAANGVLRVELGLFPAGGALEYNHPVTVGSVIIYNPGSGDITVQLGPGVSTSAPTSGTGLHIVPPGALIPIPIGSKGFVLYGTAGQYVNVQAYTGLQGYGVKL